MPRSLRIAAVAACSLLGLAGCGSSEPTSAAPSSTSPGAAAATSTATTSAPPAGGATSSPTTAAPSSTPAASSSAAPTAVPAAPLPTVVVSTPVLGAVVRDIVGTAAKVTVLMGNGVDPHDWAPSAKDIAAVGTAKLVVVNGLDLEAGFDETLDQASAKGVQVFRASDHITPRATADSHDHDHDHDHGAEDPHLWLDPIRMADVATALGAALDAAGIPTAGRAATAADGLRALDARIRDQLAGIPAARRKLVTGHESMGYFADRYEFELVGAVVPSLSSQAEVSAKELAELKRTIATEKVTVLFTEIGTPKATADALAREAGVRVVELATHTMPADGRYATFLTLLANGIAGALGTP